MAYVNKRSAANGAERFTGLYRAPDGTYKSAGTFDTEDRALEVAVAAESHARRKLAGTSPADKATITVADAKSRLSSSQLLLYIPVRSFSLVAASF